VADHAPVVQGREMRDPAAHRVEHRVAVSQHRCVRVGELPEEPVVGVRDEPRRVVEGVVRTRVALRPVALGEDASHDRP